ncbi:endonuclease domain-containing protein [Micromonospora wenchangensis]|uniref:endonuclease domain-containing protein n=1 Tax=Micromonospora wenchangensis TaxID=1185415 RepID=UPI00342791E2
MPPRPHRPAALVGQVFRGSDAIRQGLLTRHQLRGASWLRLGHDVYADARLARNHALTCRAALLRMPAGTLVAGPSAAYLHGIEHAAGFGDEVHVLVPRAARVGSQGAVTSSFRRTAGTSRIRLEADGARRDAAGGWPGAAGGWSGAGDGWPGPPGGIRVHSVAIPGEPVAHPRRYASHQLPEDATPTPPEAHHLTSASLTTQVRLRPGTPTSALEPQPPLPTPPALSGPPTATAPPALPRSSPALAAWETAAWLDPVRAVGIVDSLLGRGLTSQAALAEIAARFADRRGAVRARRVFDLTDPAAQSPPESHLRVRLVLAGLPRPVAQHPVLLPSGLVLHPDLAWPQFRVAVEYDGHWHSDPGQLHRDRRRLNHLVAAGWTVLHVTSRQLRDDFPTVAGEVRMVLTRRGWRR